MKCPKCRQDVDKLWAIPDGEYGVTEFVCDNCLPSLMRCFGYSRSQVIRYAKLAELNKDLEDEIEKSGLCENDFEPNELLLDEIPVRCPVCGYNWPILKPFHIHDEDKCPKKHCPGCGGHVTSARREARTHWYSWVSPDGVRYSVRATATAAKSIGPGR